MSTPEPSVDPLPHLEGVTVVFVSRYHDQPLAGLAAYRGLVHWFSVPYGEGVAVLYPLSDEERAFEEEGRRLFETSVGTHWSLDPTSGRRGTVLPRSGWDAFYGSVHAQDRSYDDRLPLGRFLLHPPATS